MKRTTVPVIVTFAVGSMMIVDYFLKIPGVNSLAATFRAWGVIVSTFALGIGAVNLLVVHSRNIRHRKGSEAYSIVLIGSLVLTALFGTIGGLNSSAFSFMYEAIIQPVNAAVASMLAFFIGSAAYRAFRIRNIDATILLAVGLVVLIAQAPMGQVMFPPVASLSSWIMKNINLAGQRGIIIGSGIAFIGLSIRVIVGLERSYLG